MILTILTATILFVIILVVNKVCNYINNINEELRNINKEREEE